MILDDLIESRITVRCTLKSEFDVLDHLLEFCGKLVEVPPPVKQHEVDNYLWHAPNDLRITHMTEDQRVLMLKEIVDRVYGGSMEEYLNYTPNDNHLQ